MLIVLVILFLTSWPIGENKVVKFSIEHLYSLAVVSLQLLDSITAAKNHYTLREQLLFHDIAYKFIALSIILKLRFCTLMSNL